MTAPSDIAAIRRRLIAIAQEVIDLHSQVAALEAAHEADEPPAPLIDPDLITIGEAAKWIGKSYDATRKMIHRGGLVVYRFGKPYVSAIRLREFVETGRPVSALSCPVSGNS